jgi:hypothetical protein
MEDDLCGGAGKPRLSLDSAAAFLLVRRTEAGMVCLSDEPRTNVVDAGLDSVEERVDELRLKGGTGARDVLTAFLTGVLCLEGEL